MKYLPVITLFLGLWDGYMGGYLRAYFQVVALIQSGQIKLKKSKQHE